MFYLTDCEFVFHLLNEVVRISIFDCKVLVILYFKTFSLKRKATKINKNEFIAMETKPSFVMEHGLPYAFGKDESYIIQELMMRYVLYDYDILHHNIMLF